MIREAIELVLFLLTVMLVVSWVAVLDARVGALEAHYAEVVIENRMLARKLGESHFTGAERDRRRDLSLQLAVAGFRSGSWRAYDSIVREAQRNVPGFSGGFYARR